mgnify:CR=1 FL=1
MISCSQYDYIEIVCLYKYPVQLTLTSGDMVLGKALDTQRNSDAQECILLLTEQRKELSEQEKVLIVLDDIRQLKVTIANPHFTTINF